MGDLAKASNMAPAPETTGIRRIITTHRPDGEAVIAEDRICPNRFVMGGNPLFVDNEIWKIEQQPASNAGDPVDPATSFTFVPPAGGNVCRILEIPPDTTLGTDGEGNPVKPLFHRTASTDYAVVLRGEITAVLDKQETVMRAGDIMVQRGSIHAWSNRTNEQCLMLFVLCGAEPIEGLPIM
ncbi:MAG: cupin domain-containing protein [Lachnospiraceae bacterium]|nr:cupin domain-containing protein [Lachnospiraceae bacterium]